MKQITVLGSTGSIGTQTLEVVRSNPDQLQVVALTAGNNSKILEEQIREFHPQYASLSSKEAADSLQQRVKDCGTKILWGMEGNLQCATLDEVDTVVASMVGMIGLRPVIEAIKSGKNIALANKETLVTAGHIILPLAKEHKVTLYPVDSEHSAIFQCLQGLSEKDNQIDKILLTASGGPFLHTEESVLSTVKACDALKHPNWFMGPKITIDSASMINKGLEVIEAKWLFGVDFDQVQVVVQPKSIIHSMVQFVDGSVIAQLGMPDMKLPIQYALTYPDRCPLSGDRLDFTTLSEIRFEQPPKHLQGLQIAIEAGREGGSMPTVMNAANEYAVAAYLNDQIGFLDIYDFIRRAMEQHQTVKNPGLDEILEIEKATYAFLQEYMKRK